MAGPELRVECVRRKVVIRIRAALLAVDCTNAGAVDPASLTVQVSNIFTLSASVAPLQRATIEGKAKELLAALKAGKF